MRKIQVLLFTAMFVSFGSQAQQAGIDQSPAKAVYVEVGGPGLLSINYDMRLGPKKDGFGFRAGFGGWSIKESRLILVPLGINYITSKNNRDYFEAGAGGTIVSNSAGSGTGPFKSSFGFLNLGYRKQPSDGGYFFKASLVPVFGQGFFWPYYAGVGFGYTF
jgi:hypothetical protein